MSAGIWIPEQLFSAETVFLLGGGLSLLTTDIGAIRGQPTIAINGAATVAPWAPILFFRDVQWYLYNKRLVDGWKGIAVTTNQSAAAAAPAIKRVATSILKDFTPPGSPLIRNGRSSGHIAVSLAVTMGARRIVLLGYDCRFVDGRSHWHNHYRDATPFHLYENDFLPAWRGWGDAAKRAGVEIFLACESAIQEFPFRPLSDFLGQ
jgi:hypothetical protein